MSQRLFPHRLETGILSALAMTMIGCGLGASTFEDDDQNRKHPLSYYEATLRPSDFDEEIEVVQKAHQETRTSPLPDLPPDSLTIEEEVIQGFRIQIFATASIDEATAAKTLASRQVGEDSVYVVYDPPVYKVRVGDYGTRLEASRKLSSLIDKGYPDAWIVSDRIVQRKLVRLPSKTPGIE